MRRCKAVRHGKQEGGDWPLFLHWLPVPQTGSSRLTAVPALTASATNRKQETDRCSCTDCQCHKHLSGQSYNHFPSAQFPPRCVINNTFSILFCNLPNFILLFNYSISHLLDSSVGTSNFVKLSPVQYGSTPAYYLLYLGHFFKVNYIVGNEIKIDQVRMQKF